MANPSNQISGILMDRFIGALRCHAIGDALGSPHELTGRVPYDEYTGIIQYTLRYRSRFQGFREGVVGQVSDDTEMTISLFEAILSKKWWDRETVLQYYLAWANSGSMMMGRNTRTLLKGVTTINGYQDRWDKSFPPEVRDDGLMISLTLPGGSYVPVYTAPKVTQSNGTLMRCIPLFLLLKMNLQSGWIAVIGDVWLTNPNSINLEASIIYLQIFLMIDQGKTHQEIYQWLVNCSIQPVIKSAIGDGLNPTSNRNIDGVNKGWVAHALYCAIYALRLSEDPNESYRSIINKIILMKGDADTNAAIAGGLLGFYYGWNKISTDPITGENWAKVLSADTSKGDYKRPEIYHPKRYDQLIQQLVY